MVRNAKAKIRRTKKNYGVDISSQIDLPSIETFKTRKQFNEWKEKQGKLRFDTSLQFVKNEYGVVASKKEIRKAEKDTKTAIVNAKKMIKSLEKLPVYIDKKKQMTMKQRMGIMDTASVTGINVPKPFNFKEIKDKYQLGAKVRGMAKQASDDYYDKKMEVFKRNFIDKLNFTFGFMGDELDEFLNKLEQMDTLEFYQMFQMYPDSFDFSLYGSEGDEGYEGLTEDFFYRIQSDYEHYMQTEYGRNDLKYY
ncbi:DNA terminal protein [Bacillus phage Harambe]|uniref:Terminal protein n=1 Tax=Bacillus phage Harambe TaxID=1981931 RepID=A0A1W6JSA3_9CAUD|nr:DNA terminal protein [Bacillus phage Harambe]ARM70153.1 terminal protein [Bacillus phage Harambe]